MQGERKEGFSFLTVVSYNIKSALYHPDGLEAVAHVLEELQPDVVALQEVDRRAVRSGGVDQVGWLAQRLGMHGIFGPSFDLVRLAEASPHHPRITDTHETTELPEGGEYGNAMLSRWPIVHHAVNPLPMPSKWDRCAARWPPEPRTALATILQSPYGALHVLCTHFGLQPDERLAQASALLDIVEAWVREGPLIVAGDLNALPESAEIARLRERLVDVADALELTGEARLTFPSGPLGARTADGWAGALDYFFVRDLVPLDVFVLHDTAQASDHQPLVARLAWLVSPPYQRYRPHRDYRN